MAPTRPLMIQPKVTISGNGKPFAVTPEIIPFDSNKITRIPLDLGAGEGELHNNHGTLQTGIPFTVKSTSTPAHEPLPVKALPMRYKDGASANIQYLDVDQGMPSSYVLSLLEDSKGNMWFGTDGEGVCRYNGIGFTNFNTKNGLPGSAVRSICEDRNGNIWFATDGGICEYDGTHFTCYTEKGGLPSNLVTFVFQDSKNNMWFGSENRGAWMFDGKIFVAYSTHEGLPSNAVNAVSEDASGNIWFATKKGSAAFDGLEFRWYTPMLGKDTLNVSSIAEDNQHHTWLGTSENGVYGYFDTVIQHFNMQNGLPSNVIWRLTKERNGNLLISCTYGAISIFDGKYFEQYGLNEGLSNSKVREVIEDHDGNIWCGTDGGGVNKLNAGSFHYYINNSYFQNSRVRPVTRDSSGILWFGTEFAGLSRFDGHFFQSYGPREGISDFGARALLVDRGGIVWLGGTGRGVDRIADKSITNFTTTQGLAGNAIMHITKDSKDALWFACYDGGASKLDKDGFTNYTREKGLSSNKVFTAVEDNMHRVWFGTDGGGLCLLFNNQMQVISEKEGLPSNTVTTVLEDHAHRIWIGTIGGGICRMDGDKLYAYSKKNGLSDNNVWSIIEDNYHRLWVGTDRGLNLLQPLDSVQYRITSFGLQDGLRSIDFNLHSAVIDNENRCWWGTGKGLVSLNLDIPLRFDTPRSLRLLELQVNEQTPDYRGLDAEQQEKIQVKNVVPFSNIPANPTFAYDQNHLTLHFTATDWTYENKIKYSYRLIGLDNHWSMASEETKADYRNLKHGHYVFELRAIGASQEWTKPIQYAFSIQPAWWQTWWFKTTIALCAALLLLFISKQIYLSKLRRQRNLMEKQLAVQMERQRISAEMHDDIGAGLSGVRLLTEITRQKLGDAPATNDIDKIHQSLGEISSKMKEVIWSLNAEHDHLSNLVYFIQKQVRTMLENYPCELSISIPELIPDIEIGGQARRNIYLAVKEAIHNIIKHAGANRVNLKIACEETLAITISDNGKGLMNGVIDQGNGLNNMRNRMAQLQGKFTSINNNGLTIIFEIPLKQTG